MKYLLCAKVGAPFGIKGALHLYPFSGQQDSLLNVKNFYTKRKDLYNICSVVSLRLHGNHLIVVFKDVVTPEAASSWTNQEIYINADDLPKLSQGQYYWYELIGMTVRSQKDQSYGVVEECYYNHHDVLRTSTGAHIPFIKDDIIVKVDKKSKTIIVDYDFNDYDDQECDSD